ncbi:UDP-N-acetylglucosamine--N-acetylmuramyl-(pentapeptide) pyrophosphoryl-undecaprenol N-acetylglucosamine transferase [Patescibacteria group bacterium]|nr:UDP-N-acetylglucosamine--N-acetylmuramyl-(pentapeptide) pyrophosphoryl-undecaprenol N-acetylglucosamine transferase [Patescibacteria group bacterium]
MKILVTGTHFTPAIATIEELRKTSGVDVVYVGRKTTQEGDKTASVESQILPAKGIKFIPIIAGRLQRVLTLYTIPSLFKIPIGFIQAFYIVLSEKPDVILSFGGYVAVPVVFLGWLLSVPIVIHEQTLVSGLANKISALFADKICLSFVSKFSLKKENTILTGNPIRKEILQPENKPDLIYERIFKTAKQKNLPVLLVTGGNQGSHILNTAVEKALDELTKIALIIHVTGDNKFNDFGRLKNKQNDHYLVKKWIGDGWGAMLSKIDLVISRAGINTLTELAFLGKPALVIPIPYLYQDEQNKNAEYFKGLGLAGILPQSKLSAESLFKEIESALRNLPLLTKAALGAKSVVITSAAKRIALETILLKKI